MNFPHSFVNLLETIAFGQNSSDLAWQTAFDLHQEKINQDAGNYLELIGKTESFYSYSMPIQNSISAFWMLIPNDIHKIEIGTLKKYARDYLEILYPDVQVSDKFWNAYIVILKRIRNYLIKGRNTKSLDFGKSKHFQLFIKQNKRCNHCHYEFKDVDIEQMELSVSYWKNDNAKLSEIDIVSESCYRTPVLDHIIPVFIGPDNESNWQILCYSCNSGKSSRLSGHLPFRPEKTYFADSDNIQSSVRYHVIFSYKNLNLNSYRTNIEIRVRKKHTLGLVNLENLEGYQN
jgi:hypothetical protein